jgi:biopolymer transport protein ExbB
MHSRVSRCLAVVLAFAGSAAPVLAQSATPAAGQAEQSLFDIIRAGIEVPSWFILAGSIAVIALIVEHFLNVRRASIAPLEQVRRARELIEARSFRECLDMLKQSRSFFAQIMTGALGHARHGFDAMHAAALEKSGELSGRMFRKAEYLNIIGNLGPLLGLLGTVWGMIEAFSSLGAGGGQASSGALAGGISKALVNTLLGLALAILGIGFFGVCRNRIESLTVAATVDALDLLEYFRPVPRGEKAAERPAPAVAAPTRPPAAPPRAARPATDTPEA